MGESTGEVRGGRASGAADGASDGLALVRVVTAYRDLLRAHQEELNRLNVYPVPDGDTGTNMALTLESVEAALDGADDLPAVCRAIAHGSLMGARGNSGVILSQILRGLTDAFLAAGRVGPSELAAGLRSATDAAYRAVMHPVEGTILSVVGACAAAAEAAGVADRGAPGAADRSGPIAGAGLVALLEQIASAARAAVDRTPEQLPVLAQAGVVDAGGRGLSLLFDAWLHVLDGRALPEPRTVADAGAQASETARRAAVTSDPAAGDPRGPRYEVMFLLDAPDDAIEGFRRAWDVLGESIVVVGGDGVWNCHVHTDRIGAAIEAGIAAGRPSRLEVTDLWEQVEKREADWVAASTGPASAARPPAATAIEAEPVACAVVAVASGEGVTALLRSLGASAVVAGGQSMNPSTQQLLDAVEAVDADGVVVLPNNKNIVPVAEQAAALASRAVTVVPTRSVVEALAAMLEHDADADLARNTRAMGDAAARVRTGEVTRAVRDGVGDCGPIAAGDWIAITRAGIRARTDGAGDAAIAVVDELVGDDDELVTVLVGADGDPDDVERLRAHLAESHPAVEVEVHDGGQPLYPYLIGVE